MLCSALVWQAVFVLYVCPRINLYLYNRIYCPWRQDMVSERPTCTLRWLLLCTFIMTLWNVNNDTSHELQEQQWLQQMSTKLIQRCVWACLLHFLLTVERDRNVMSKKRRKQASSDWIWTQNIMGTSPPKRPFEPESLITKMQLSFPLACLFKFSFFLNPACLHNCR